MPSSLYAINRRHSVNHEYFSVIDTQEKAYWAGLLWADGNISKTTERASGPNRLRLSQKRSQRDHLQSFLEAIEADYRIQDSKSSLQSEVSYVDINSRQLCASLEALGYGLKKDRTSIPPMPQELLRHFVRGYFDGDGCLSLYQQKVKQWVIEKQEWSITGSPLLIQRIKEAIEIEVNVSRRVKVKTYARTEKSVSLRYGRKSDVVALHDYLYKGATVYLTEKHQQFVQLLNRV